MDCLVDQAGYRKFSEGSSKALQCAETDPPERGSYYTRTSYFAISFQMGTLTGTVSFRSQMPTMLRAVRTGEACRGG